MSSSVGYYYSAVAREAEQVRALRAELAVERVRYERIKRQARKLAVKSPEVAIGVSDSSAELSATVASVRAAAAEVEREVDEAWGLRWRARIGGISPRRAVVNESSATRELAAVRAEDQARAAAVSRQDGLARASAVSDAGELLKANALHCGEEDLDQLTADFNELSAMDRVADIRAAGLELAIRVRDSMRRRKETETTEETRAELLALITEAPASEQAVLAESVRNAQDPAELRNSVHQAIERADLARSRDTVVAATARALTAAGCLLGEDFVTVLADRQEAVAALPGRPDGYGVLVRLPDDGARIMAAVVRADGVTAEPAQDVAAQTAFCEDTLPKLVDSLNTGQVRLAETPFLRLEPGRRTVPTVPAGKLPKKRKRRQAPPPTGQASQLSERRHG